MVLIFLIFCFKFLVQEGTNRTIRCLQLANTLVYQSTLRPHLVGSPESRLLTLNRVPFSIFTEIIRFYQTYRSLEKSLSLAYPIRQDTSDLFELNLDGRPSN